MKNKFCLLCSAFIILSVILLVPAMQLKAGEKPPASPAKATIFHAADLIRPGEIVLLTGDWPASGVEIAVQRLGDATAETFKETGAWQHLQPLQLSTQSLKFKIPENWPMGIYACKIVPAVSAVPGFEPSAIVYLNAPDAWWLQGDGGASTASPGGWLRIFGKALHFDAASHILLEGQGKTYTISAEGANDKNGYALSARLPADLPAGGYEVSVHNGFGGKTGWKKASHLVIQKAPQWKKDVFNVRDFNTGGHTETTDWTEAVKAALAKAGANGGGTVYFSRGRYIINDELNIPAFVTLHGEGEGLVNLYWPPRDKALKSLITGIDDFAVEDIGLYTDGIHHDVIAGRHNMRVQRVRIRADAYYRHDDVGNAHAVKPVTISSRDMGAGIRINGDNAVLTDCEIYHSAEAIEMYHTHGGLIARNRLDYGKGPLQAYGVSGVIIEDNDCSASSLWASGIGISLYYYSASSYHVYFAHNHIRQNYGGDREAVTMDGHGTAYLGKVDDVKGSQLILKEETWWGKVHKDLVLESELQQGIDNRRFSTGFPAPEEWHGITMFIIEGKGAGQYRNVLEASGRQVKIDMPWDVPPDSSSIVSIGKFQGRMLFIGNEFRDAGTSVQLYPPNCDCIVAENQCWRATSTNAGAEINQRTFNLPKQPDQQVTSLRVELSWYNQFLDNHIWEGNGWGNASSVLYVYGRGQLIDPAKPWALDLPISRGHVMRGNQLDNNANILIEGTVTDMVVEKNTVKNAQQGILVRKLNTNGNEASKFPARILIEKNTFLKIDKEITLPR